jgi:hypothetical protein
MLWINIKNSNKYMVNLKVNANVEFKLSLLGILNMWIFKFKIIIRWEKLELPNIILPKIPSLIHIVGKVKTSWPHFRGEFKIELLDTFMYMFWSFLHIPFHWALHFFLTCVCNNKMVYIHMLFQCYYFISFILWD